MAARAAQNSNTSRRNKPQADGDLYAALLADYGLNRDIYARMLGVTQARLARWETERKQPNRNLAARLKIISDLLAGLARVMRREFIPTWLVTPNDICKEAGAQTPLDLLEQGNFDQVRDMIYYLESGIPT